MRVTNKMEMLVKIRAEQLGFRVERRGGDWYILGVNYPRILAYVDKKGALRFNY
jgi:hypothetical protein